MNQPQVTLSEGEFAGFQKLIEHETGIYLNATKKELLTARLAKRLRSLQLASYGAYLDYVLSGRDPDERAHMFDAICTNETHFFREPNHFAFLQREALSKLVNGAAKGRRPKRIRVWSAACSTGEEPYSIAMTLLNRFPPGSGWQLSVLATDLSTRALAHAKRACYSEQRASELPAELARLFARRAHRPVSPYEPSVSLVPELQQLVEFKQLNLTAPPPVHLGRFDLVFCRNVMIYFQTATRRRVVEMLLQHLDPDGYLFLGHAESLIGMSERVRCVGPSIYAPCEAARSRIARRT